MQASLHNSHQTLFICQQVVWETNVNVWSSATGACKCVLWSDATKIMLLGGSAVKQRMNMRESTSCPLLGMVEDLCCCGLFLLCICSNIMRKQEFYLNDWI